MKNIDWIEIKMENCIHSLFLRSSKHYSQSKLFMFTLNWQLDGSIRKLVETIIIVYFIRYGTCISETYEQQHSFCC